MIEILAVTTLLGMSAVGNEVWHELQPAHHPAPRAAMDGVYLDHAEAGLIFGGATTTRSLGDTWRWDGTDWEGLSGPAPSPRSFYAMTYDATREEVVLFGGGLLPTPMPLYGETWIWSDDTWILATDQGPSARVFSRMTFDRKRGEVVLFGGLSAEGAMNDTWLWDGSKWREADVAAPAARMEPAMAYDEAREEVVLFGGDPSVAVTLYADTWLWNGKRWRETDADGPVARAGARMVYDPHRERVILFGGKSRVGDLDREGDDLWEWDGETWTEMTPATGPTPRARPAMFFDRGQRHAVLFGGAHPQSSEGDTWLYFSRRSPYGCASVPAVAWLLPLALLLWRRRP